MAQMGRSQSQIVLVLAFPPGRTLILRGSERGFHSGHMTQKKLVLDVIDALPDEASLAEIAERIDFLAAIQKALIKSTAAKESLTMRLCASWPHGLQTDLVPGFARRSPLTGTI